MVFRNRLSSLIVTPSSTSHFQLFPRNVFLKNNSNFVAKKNVQKLNPREKKGLIIEYDLLVDV